MALLILKYLTIAVVGALVALILHVGDPAPLLGWLAAMLFGAWIVGPAIAPYFLARRFRNASWFVHVMLAFLVLSSALSAAAYYQALFVSISSTAALILIFMPLWQWAALVCVGLLCAAIGSIHRRGSRDHDVGG